MTAISDHLCLPWDPCSHAAWKQLTISHQVRLKAAWGFLQHAAGTNSFPTQPTGWGWSWGGGRWRVSEQDVFLCKQSTEAHF